MVRQCRICLETENPSTMVAPCDCRGTAKYIHTKCLNDYIFHYPDRLCRVCRQPMYVASPSRMFVDCVLTGLLLTLLAFSSVRILDKAILFVAAVAVFAIYYIYNIISVSTELFAIAVAMLFFMAAHHELFILLIGCLGLIATVYVLSVYIPIRYVMALGAIVVGMSYMILFAISISHQLDAYAGSFFMALVFLAWHGWIQLHPMRNIGD